MPDAKSDTTAHQPPHDYCTHLSPTAHREAWSDFWDALLRQQERNDEASPNDR